MEYLSLPLVLGEGAAAASEQLVHHRGPVSALQGGPDEVVAQDGRRHLHPELSRNEAMVHQEPQAFVDLVFDDYELHQKGTWKKL